MSKPATFPDGYGPEWAAGVADLADRAQAAFGQAGVDGCLSVVDLQPWRVLDAWWLRRRLEPLARLTGRPVRYVPCAGAVHMPREQRVPVLAPAWSVGAAPVDLHWTAGSSAPHCRATGQPWVPDGAVLVLAGDAAQRMPQDLLLAHHGQIHEWRGEPGQQQWHPLDPASRYPASHSGWIAESLRAYTQALPSSMLSLPGGYWHFLEQAMAWASHGCLVLARAEGWSSLAQIREDAVQRPEVRADSPPVNFHWLEQHAPLLRASAHTLHADRSDTVQLIVSGLADADAMALCARACAATRSSRNHRASAVRSLAANGALEGALAVLQQSEHDPALLRAAWDALAQAAAPAAPAIGVQIGAQLGAWLEHVVTDNPWIGDDADLLRGAGHLALACARVDLAQTALRALDELGQARAADLAALARCHEQLGRFDAALAVCTRALSREPGHEEALAARERVTLRMAALVTPWRVQHGAEALPLLLDPLHAAHAPMLLRQMRDPSIASMTALPPLAEGDDGNAWIQARLDEGVAAYALVHRRLGFVGYLDLRVWQRTAFVCYWIGSDFQGLGLCAPAIALACDLALRNGIELLLSSAYDDNARSLRALRKCGFAVMDARAAPPDGDRTFLMLPTAPMSGEQARQRLVEFCANTNSGLRFVPPADETAPPSPETLERRLP
jgi:RimJ/RimL family protein N-acetyltransferase